MLKRHFQPSKVLNRASQLDAINMQPNLYAIILFIEETKSTVVIKVIDWCCWYHAFYIFSPAIKGQQEYTINCLCVRLKLRLHFIISHSSLTLWAFQPLQHTHGARTKHDYKRLLLKRQKHPFIFAHHHANNKARSVFDDLAQLFTPPLAHTRCLATPGRLAPLADGRQE